MKTNHNALLSLYTAITAIFMCCVALCGCRTPSLEQGGAYNVSVTNAVTGNVISSPDYPFFVVDSSFNLAYQTVDGIFTYEQDNRATLFAINPEIKHTLDKARPIAVDVVRRYTAARADYIASHTPYELKTLQGILSELNTLAVTVQTATK